MATQVPEQPIKDQIDELRIRLAEAQQDFANLNEALKLQLGATPEELEDFKSLKRQLIQLYELQLRGLEQMQQLTVTTDQLRQQISAWTGFEEHPPYPVQFSDDLWREIKNREQDIRTMRMAQTVIENDAEVSKEQLKPAAVSIQQSADQLNDLNSDENTAHARWRLELDKLKLHVAEVEVATHDSDRRMITARITAREVERDFLLRKLEVADAHVQFSQQDLLNKIEHLDQENLALKKEIQQAKRDEQTLYLERAQNMNRLARLKEAAKNSPDDLEQIKLIEQTGDILSLKTEASAMRRRGLLEMVRVIDRVQALWKLRFEIMNAPGADRIKSSLTIIQAEQTQLDQQREVVLSMLATTQTKMAYEQSRRKAGDEPEAGREQSHKLAEAYRQQLEAWYPLQARQALYSDLLERTRLEAEQLKAELPWTERAGNLLLTLDETAGKLADFEIYSVTDTVTVEGREISGTRRVTLGQILLFFLIITSGFWLTAKIVHLGLRGSKYMFKLNVDSAALFGRVAHLVLSLGVAVAALTTMKIPLTVFAFMGGAIALAIGFGAQNLLNNFVSGLILLIERPVKTGDIVDVEGVTGRITQIGARCCQIRGMDGVEMLVPNSAMIEKTVTNWTLSDQKRRASVSIGIAYGSPLDHVQALIGQAVTDHAEVLADPPPLVLFEDFGESALMFNVYYWLDLAHVADRRVVASEIRLSLNHRLTEAGIVIAYPQRDLHLHSSTPLEVLVKGHVPN